MAEGLALCNLDVSNIKRNVPAIHDRTVIYCLVLGIPMDKNAHCLVRLDEVPLVFDARCHGASLPAKLSASTETVLGGYLGGNNALPVRLTRLLTVAARSSPLQVLIPPR